MSWPCLWPVLKKVYTSENKMIQKYDSKNLELKSKKLKIVQEYLTANMTQSELKNKHKIGT